MLRFRNAAPALATLSILALPAEAETIQHGQGAIDLAETPETVVVFDIASLDTLHSLGVEVQGVPSGVKPPHLARYAGEDAPVAGSLVEPDLDAVRALDPDLIIVGGRSAAQFETLSAIAPTIDLTVDGTGHLGSSLRNIRTLAAIFDRAEEGEARIEAIESKVEEIAALAPGAGTLLTVLTAGEEMSAHGEGSRFGILFDDYGFVPAATGLATGSRGEAITAGFIAETDPEWIFVVDRQSVFSPDASSLPPILANEDVRGTRAGRNDRIVRLDPVNWYLMGASGATTLELATDEILRALSGSR